MRDRDPGDTSMQPAAEEAYYSYQDLESASRVRVLELLAPSSGDSNTPRCRIYPTGLNSPPFQHSAMSHVWGDPAVKSCKRIQIANGTDVLISPN